MRPPPPPPRLKGSRPPVPLGAPRPERTNLVNPAPPGTDCCLSKCWWPATVLITFKQTGGTSAYCDDHGWPHRPRKLVLT